MQPKTNSSRPGNSPAGGATRCANRDCDVPLDLAAPTPNPPPPIPAPTVTLLMSLVPASCTRLALTMSVDPHFGHFFSMLAPICICGYSCELPAKIVVQKNMKKMTAVAKNRKVLGRSIELSKPSMRNKPPARKRPIANSALINPILLTPIIGAKLLSSAAPPLCSSRGDGRSRMLRTR